MKKKEHDPYINVTHMFSPGVFQVRCKSTGRSFFGQAETLLPEMERFYNRLKDGVCESTELLSDVEKYGIADFDFIIIYYDVRDKEERKRLLQEKKSKQPLSSLYN